MKEYSAIRALFPGFDFSSAMLTFLVYRRHGVGNTWHVAESGLASPFAREELEL